MTGVSRRGLVRSGLALAGIAGATGIAACGAGEPSGGAATSKLTGTLELLHTNEASNERTYRTMADAYNKRGGPQVQLRMANGANQEQYTTAVTAAWAAGSPPDLFHSWYQWLPAFIGQGFAAPIDQLVARDKWNKDQIVPSAWDIAEWQKQHYGLAYSIGVLFMYYNLDIMSQNGVPTNSFPTAWSQWDQLSPKLTKRLAGTSGETFDYISLYPPNRSDAWYIWPQTNGAQLISSDGRKAQFASENVIQTAEWSKGFIERLGGFPMVDAWRKEVPGGDQNHVIIWTAGKAWAMLGHDGYRNQVKDRKPDMKWTAQPVASGPMGPKDNKNNVYSSGSTLSIQKGGKKTNEAWDFLKFSVTSEAGGNVQKSAASTASSAAASEYGLKEVLPMFPLAKGFRAPLHPAFQKFEPIYFKTMNDFVTGANPAPIRGALAETNRLIQNILDEYWAANPGK